MVPPVWTVLAITHVLVTLVGQARIAAKVRTEKSLSFLDRLFLQETKILIIAKYTLQSGVGLFFISRHNTQRDFLHSPPLCKIIQFPDFARESILDYSSEEKQICFLLNVHNWIKNPIILLFSLDQDQRLICRKKKQFREDTDFSPSLHFFPVQPALQVHV